MGPSVPSRARSAWLLPIIAVSVLCTLASMLARPLTRQSFAHVWDDAFMFVRYADVLGRTGKLAWNDDGPAVYGLTSLTHFLLVLPLRLGAHLDALAVMLIASMVSSFAWLGATAWVTVKLPLCNLGTRAIGATWVAAAIALSEPHWRWVAQSGMDTMGALTFLTLWLALLARCWEREDTSKGFATVGTLAGAALLVRPDLLVITFGALGLLVAIDASRRAAWARAMAYALGAAGLVALATTWLLHSPLPLPFWAKMLSPYDRLDPEHYAAKAAEYPREFLRWMLPLLLPIASDWLLAAYRRRWRERALDAALLAPAAIFFLIQWKLVTPIMGMFARFYYPTIPVLVVLALRSFDRLLPLVPTRVSGALGSGARMAIGLLLAGVLGVSLVWRERDELRECAKSPGLATFDIHRAPLENALEYWPVLDAVIALPSPASIATTELGVPSVLAPQDKIIDMSGLHDARFLQKKADIVGLVLQEAPDVIYVLPAYIGMTEALLRSPELRARYELFDAEPLGTFQWIALRRDSQCYATLRQAVERRLAR